MAHYLVTAKPKPDRLGNLLTNLRRNAYASMRPFGRTLTYSLQNARSRQDGLVTWEEEDYCSPPLAQERAAVFWMSSSMNSISHAFKRGRAGRR
jgi:hypothetical protein